MEEDLVEAMAKAIKAREALPRMPDDLDLEQAYAIQKALVDTVAEGAIAGLKAHDSCRRTKTVWTYASINRLII